MPWLEKRGDSFRIKFRHGGRNLQVALGTSDPVRAERDLARFEENMLLLERGRLEPPAGADLGRFLLCDGKLTGKPASDRTPTLAELCALYEANFTAGAKEANTRAVERIHLAHVRRLLSGTTRVTAVTSATLQGYVDRRAAEKFRGRAIKPQTVRKEVATFQTVWNWGYRNGHVPAPCPATRID